MVEDSLQHAWRIEQYKPAYAPALRRLFLDSRRATFHWQADQFKLSDFDTDTEGEMLLVALFGQEPVGFVSWWPPQNFIHHLFVDPQWLRRGVGRGLLNASLKQIPRPVRLKCQLRNENARAFYMSQGWEVEKQEENANGAYYVMALK